MHRVVPDEMPTHLLTVKQKVIGRNFKQIQPSGCHADPTAPHHLEEHDGIKVPGFELPPAEGCRTIFLVPGQQVTASKLRD